MQSKYIHTHTHTHTYILYINNQEFDLKEE